MSIGIVECYAANPSEIIRYDGRLNPGLAGVQPVVLAGIRHLYRKSTLLPAVLYSTWWQLGRLYGIFVDDGAPRFGRHQSHPPDFPLSKAYTVDCCTEQLGGGHPHCVGTWLHVLSRRTNAVTCCAIPAQRMKVWA